MAKLAAKEEIEVSYDGARSELKIFAQGEMAERTRLFEWDKTAVGSIDQWPDSLVQTLNTLLDSKFPMMLWWGEELVQFYNDACGVCLGSERHPRALGQRAAECWVESWATLAPQIEAVMRKGQASWSNDLPVRTYSGGTAGHRPWTAAFSPVRDMTGKVLGTLVVCSEMNERSESQRTGRGRADENRLSLVQENRLSLVQEERRLLAELFRQAPAFFALLRGEEHVFELVNPLYQELVGNRQVIGKTVREAIPELEDQGFFGILDRVYRTGERYVGHETKVRLARSQGQPFEDRFLNFVYEPMREVDGKVVGVIALGVDVTVAKQAEKALAQAEKLAAVGRLASSIAHEINNPLEAIMNLLFLVESTTDDQLRRNYLAQTQAELARVTKITTQTLRFHRQSAKPRGTALPEVLRSVLTLLRAKLQRAQISVEERYSTTREITAYEADLRQVFANLVGNAIDAIESGGRLVLAVRDAHGLKDGSPGVSVTVADTGQGMSETTRAHIFDPFFTTRATSGTGLGLWVSAGILEHHHASVRVKSSQDPKHHGTVFRIFFPLAGAAEA